MATLHDPASVTNRNSYGMQKSDVLLYEAGSVLVSAQVSAVQGGYIAQWWATRWDGGSQIQVASAVTLPIYGQNMSVAERNLGGMLDDVVRLSSNSGGMSSAADWERPEADHVEAHLGYYLGKSQDLSLLGRTAFLYDILKEFRVSNPAKVLAEIEGVNSVRTVHDRIARARAQGLIPPGRMDKYAQ